MNKKCFDLDYSPVVILVTSMVVMYGCSSVNETLTTIRDSASKALASTAPASAPASAPQPRGIAGTELDGIFRKFPVTDRRQPQQFPRAAITITSATSRIFRGTAPAGDECITFDVRLWMSATQHKSFKDLRMCSAQRTKEVAFASLNNWPIMRTVLDNTGAARTDGPQRPATNFPTDPGVVDGWFDRPSRGIYFIGSILYQMGYDWMQPGEYRVWFVSAPRS